VYRKKENMMYKNQLAVAIKSNGKILRETKDLVHLPFGSEFSVLVKNLSNKRAKFTLNIDGTSALDNSEIIVNANSDIEIKRFIRNGNMSDGNAFRFIERTEAIESGPRGIKIDDGIVRVEYWFEADQAVFCGYSTSVSYPRGLSDFTFGNIVGSTNQSMTNIASAQACDVGITVPGSKVSQKFTPVYGFTPGPTSSVIILRLAGHTGDVEITKPITVATKQECITCGKINKMTSNFCSGCGTALLLF
jgi:hypothetical protein